MNKSEIMTKVILVQKKVTKINVKCGVDKSGLVWEVGTTEKSKELMCFMASGQSDK